MEREINIRYLIDELLGRWKSLLIAGIIGAIVIAGLGYMQSREAVRDTKYCSYGVLRVVDEERAGADLEAENKYEIQGRDVIQSVAEDKDVTAAGVSAREIQNSIYLETSSLGTVIRVNIVTGDQQLSNLICRRVLNYARIAFRDDNKTVETIMGVTNRGAVTVQAWENPNDPRITANIIHQTAAPSISPAGMIKKGILGFVVGIVLWGLFICTRFIVRGSIKYAEQACDITKLPLLGVVDNTGRRKKKKGSENGQNTTADIYSNIFLNRDDMRAVNLLATCCSDGERMKLLNRLAAFSVQMGENPLIIEVKEDKGTRGKIAEKNGFDYVAVSKAFAIRKARMEESLEGLKKTYGKIFLTVSGPDMLSVSKRIGTYAEGTIILVKEGMSKEKELADITAQLREMDITLIGTLFMTD